MWLKIDGLVLLEQNEQSVKKKWTNPTVLSVGAAQVTPSAGALWQCTALEGKIQV